MMAIPIRSRIAPGALLFAFAFVVIGFLRADREMARAEAERVDITASETATLVEVFLLRHLVQLRAAEQALGIDSTNTRRRQNKPSTRESIALQSVNSAGLRATFEAIGISDSSRNVLARFTARADGMLLPGDSVLFSMDDSTFRSIRVILDRTLRSNAVDRLPNISVVGSGRRAKLVFIEPLAGQVPRAVVAVTSLDSLSESLRRSQRTKSFSIMIRSATDTVLALPGQGKATATRTIERTLTMPFDAQWLLAMSYSPPGRGVRIALWIVGLGAIVGLGIGLLLERREASRIADRSSELEHLSAELLRANRAKSEFLANVSHELRTPLNAIVGFVDLLRDGVYGALNARQVGPVERIEASANHLRHLVDQILDLAKMAAGRLEVHSEPIELRPFVFDVASEVEPLITEKGLSFSLAVGATLPRVRTDPTHLRQILINLLGNAVKFTNNGGISVRGKLLGTEDRPGALLLSRLPSRLGGTATHATPPRASGVWIALQVVDSGVGIPAKDCERIFDEFEQVNAGPRGDSMRRGTGLGLPISRRLARLLGGDISVESEPGRGSVFTVWLPVDPADLRGDQAA